MLQRYILKLFLIGTTRELWPMSKMKSLEMTPKLDIPVSVKSNPDAGKLVPLNVDIRHAVEELDSLRQLPHVSYEYFQKILGL